MAVFEYKGLNKSGKSVKGIIDADSSRTAKMKLKKDGIYVVDIKNKSNSKQKASNRKSAQKKSANIADISSLTRQLATLLKANVPLVDSLQAVSEQMEIPFLQEVLSEAKNSVNEGGSLSRALAKYPKVFNKIYISMVEAGEMSGTLDIILIRLAEFTEAQNELNTRVRSAMLYPIIMFVFTAAMLMGLFVFVIPKITVVFESSPDLVLPWYSKMVIDISGFMVNYWWVIIMGSVLSFFIFNAWKSSTSGSVQYDALLLKVPVIGPLVRMIAVSRFTRTLSTLLTGGVPMLNSMSIVRNVVSNEILASAIDNARDNIKEGESIAGPLKKSGQFPPIVIHMVNIGEKTGELENMLTQVSDSYDFQVKNQVDGLTSILEPIMLVVMGGVIAIIVFAVMVPIFELSNMAG